MFRTRENPAPKPLLTQQDRKGNEIVLHGVVIEGNNKKPVSGARIKGFARMSDNQELPLCHSISGNDGHYSMYVYKDTIPADTNAIIVRASHKL